MKSLYYALIVSCLLGCSLVRPTKQVTNNQDRITKAERVVDNTIVRLEKNENDKKIQTSILAAGISYSLNKVTNTSIEVETALTLNERVVSIVGAPHIDELKKIQLTVDLLNSAIAEERNRGQKMLNDRDLIISRLQKEKNDLKTLYDDQMWKIAEEAKDVARGADNSQATLNQMSGMFGLNAVWWGLKKFFVSCLTWIVVFFVVFTILRLLSATNPIAASIFSIFNLMGSAVISIFKGLTPKAFELAKFTDTKTTDLYKETVRFFVNEVQELKQKQKDNPDKKFTLDELLARLDREMNQQNKDLIEQVLKEEKWKK